MRLKNTFALSPAIPLPATSKGAIQVTLSDSHTFLLTSFSPHRLRKKLRTAGASSCPSPPPTAPRRQKPTPNCPSGQDEAARVRELASGMLLQTRSRCNAASRAGGARSWRRAEDHRGRPRWSVTSVTPQAPAVPCAATPGCGMEDTSPPCIPPSPRPAPHRGRLGDRPGHRRVARPPLRPTPRRAPGPHRTWAGSGTRNWTGCPPPPRPHAAGSSGPPWPL